MTRGVLGLDRPRHCSSCGQTYRQTELFTENLENKHTSVMWPNILLIIHHTVKRLMTAVTQLAGSQARALSHYGLCASMLKDLLMCPVLHLLGVQGKILRQLMQWCKIRSQISPTCEVNYKNGDWTIWLNMCFLCKREVRLNHGFIRAIMSNRGGNYLSFYDFHFNLNKMDDYNMDRALDLLRLSRDYLITFWN